MFLLKQLNNDSTDNLGVKSKPRNVIQNIPLTKLASQRTSKFATLFTLKGEMLTDLLPLSSTFLLNEFLISLMTAEE